MGEKSNSMTTHKEQEKIKQGQKHLINLSIIAGEVFDHDTDSILNKYNITDDKILFQSITVGLFCLLNATERSELSSSLKYEELLEFKESLELLKKITFHPLLHLYLGLNTDKIKNTFSTLEYDIERLNSQRGGKNKLLKEHISKLVLSLHDYGLNWKQRRDFIYDLFVEFGLDDYGKGGEDEIKIKGESTMSEIDQKELIRKQYIDPNARTHKIIKESKVLNSYGK